MTYPSASNSWNMRVHSEKMDLDLTRIGIFESWPETGKDSMFQIFACKKYMQVHGLSINIHGTKSCPPSKLMTPYAKESDKGQSGAAVGMSAYQVHIWKILLPGSLPEQKRMDHTAERWGLRLWNGLTYHSPWQTANTKKSSLTMACNKVCNIVLYLLSVKRRKFLLHICRYKATQPLDYMLRKTLQTTCTQNLRTLSCYSLLIWKVYSASELAPRHSKSKIDY